jgi:acetyl esterase/lipase
MTTPPIARGPILVWQAALAASFVVGLAGTSPAVDVEKDVPYLGRDRAEKADLYLPERPDDGERAPAVVVIHGGGWRGGDKADAREQGIGQTLAGHGYVVLSINYVLTNDARPVTWPQNLYDCKTAVRWLRMNADRLRVDPDRIGVIGGSAGGHLSAMVAATGPEAALDPPGPYGEFPTRVQAAVILYAPAEMHHIDRAWLGKTRAEDPKVYRDASPLTHLDPKDPPFLILHGTADAQVDVEQSRILDAALDKAGVEHQLIVIDGAPHTFGLENPYKDMRATVVAFFDRHLKKAPKP